MRNKSLLLLLLSFTAVFCVNAQSEFEQLKEKLAAHPAQDTARVNILLGLSYFNRPAVETEKYALEAIDLSRKTGYVKGEGRGLTMLAKAKALTNKKAESDSLLLLAEAIANKIKDRDNIAFTLQIRGTILTDDNNKEGIELLKRAEIIYSETGDLRRVYNCQYRIANFYYNNLANYPAAMEYWMKAAATAEKMNRPQSLIQTWSNLATLYSSIGDYENAYSFLDKANKKARETNINDSTLLLLLKNNTGELCRLSGKYDEAIKAYKEAARYSILEQDIKIVESNLADVYTRMDSLPLAFQYAFSALNTKLDMPTLKSWITGILGRAYLKKQMPDSAIYYAKEGLQIAKEYELLEFLRDNAGALADAYAYKKDYPNAYKYHLQYINYRDSILNTGVKNKIAMYQYSSEMGKKQVEITELKNQKERQKSFLIVSLAGLSLIIISVFLLWRNNRQKQKANLFLERQKQKVEITLSELKSTQAQLIQSEKMASLGELTAGIAHEIQNPLNFVNNFSDVNKELLSEMNNEIENGNYDEVKSIAKDVTDNEEKINHHGKRADAIVKGMLQHSRTSTGQKELTNINALCDEYLRLSYHGLRAKDKSFNAKFETDFDPSLPKINVVPQEIGRVILNLINNAFYAVSERKKLNETGYEPTVIVSTRNERDMIEIKVKDNGTGIPEKIKDKIFQPFFTTKPTGSGTGLGLSLAYDIVTKGHGGELKVETIEGEGSEFTIYIQNS
ncbi:MAG: hypothetical protein B6D37_01930 [Sphingobacteriales bacterium UTBCD1]|jgi:signal transduction histidine kinase|nr:MAG: hypothetical protein B6D37_01930 [Sphingobacteriales bacterium UTBCD1]